MRAAATRASRIRCNAVLACGWDARGLASRAGPRKPPSKPGKRQRPVVSVPTGSVGSGGQGDSSLVGPAQAATKTSAASSLPAGAHGHIAMDRASGLDKIDAQELARARDRLARALNPQTSKLGISQGRNRRALPGDETSPTMLGKSGNPALLGLDESLRQQAASLSGRTGQPPRPQSVEVVTRDIDQELGVGELDAGGLAIGGDDDGGEQGLGGVKPGGEMGVMYEAETDSDFDEREWGNLENESPDRFDESMALNAHKRMDDITSARQALAHRRSVLEGRALAVGADPHQARMLVKAGQDDAVTAPTTGRVRRTTVSGLVTEHDPRGAVDVPIPGTFGRRSVSLDVSVPRLVMESPTDPVLLPVTLPDAPDSTRWHWVPETSTALPAPSGWNVAKGWGGFVGSKVLSVAVTPEDPLVLNEPNPVTRSRALHRVEMRKAANAGTLTPEEAAAAGLGSETSRNVTGGNSHRGSTRAGTEIITKTVDGEQVTVIREILNEQASASTDGSGKSNDGGHADDDDDDAAAKIPSVTSGNPADHFLRLGLTYKAYIGIFTSEALATSEPQELAKFFLTLALTRFTPPHELGDAASGGVEAVGEAMEALTGQKPGEGDKAWTLAQLTAASEAAQLGLDPVAAAQQAGLEETQDADSKLPRAGFSYAAYPDLDKPDSPIEPSFEDQWSYELVPGRVYGFGAIAHIGWSPMAPDDPSHRVNGGMRVAVSLTMDTMTNVLHETVFRAPAAIWDEAWASHGERMMDDTCIAWTDEAADKYA